MNSDGECATELRRGIANLCIEETISVVYGDLNLMFPNITIDMLLFSFAYIMIDD